MEEIINIPFDEFIKTVVVPEESYWFEFTDDGVVVALHPGHNVDSIKNKIKIDNDIVADVYDNKTPLSSYRVDISTGTITKIKLSLINGLTTIDDVLHRIIDKKWTNINKPDIFITYERSKSLLTFSINPVLKAFEWQGDQDMVFLVTDYNDPNILKEMISFNVNELVQYPHRFELDLPSKFSIYTRRLFDKYTFEEV